MTNQSNKLRYTWTYSQYTGAHTANTGHTDLTLAVMKCLHSAEFQIIKNGETIEKGCGYATVGAAKLACEARASRYGKTLTPEGNRIAPLYR
jgi:hypothetical protein